MSIALLLCTAPLFAQANSIQVGKGIPAVSVEKGGEIFIENDTPSYLPWNTKLMLGKVRVIQAIAGRSGAKALNAPLMAAITKAEFSEESYQTTTIVNQDDAIWGTGSFVQSSAEDGKKDFPWSSMVLDEDGVAAQQWQLTPESSTIIVQDKTGRVLFNKTGELSAEEITQVLKIIKQNL